MNLLEQLHAADRAERLAAIAAVAAYETADARTLQALAQCLGDGSKLVQRRAAEAFAALHARGVEVDGVLLATLDAAGLAHRWGAAYALACIGTPPPPALPVLLECLGARDGDLRWAAASIVVRLAQATDVGPAVHALLATGTAEQRKMAAYCVRDIGVWTPAVETALSGALGDPDAGVRLAAMSSLARLCADGAALARRLLPLLLDPEAGVRRATAAVLGTLGQRSAAVVAALQGAAASSDVSLQRAARRSLQRLGE